MANMPLAEKSRLITGIMAKAKDMQSQIEAAIPRSLAHVMSAERILRVMQTTLQIGNENILQCHVNSLCGCVMLAVQHGLELNNQDCYITPRGKQATFTIGYQGLIKLMWRSKQVQMIHAKVVYAGDEFEYEYGTNQRLRHIPRGESDDAKITHAYAKVIINGIEQFEVLDRAFLEKIKAASSATGSYSPWTQWFEAMAKKTAIRQLMKYLPISIDIQEIAAIDSVGESDQSQDLAAMYGLSQPSPAEEKAKQDRSMILELLEQASTAEELNREKTTLENRIQEGKISAELGNEMIAKFESKLATLQPEQPPTAPPSQADMANRKKTAIEFINNAATTKGLNQIRGDIKTRVEQGLFTPKIGEELNQLIDKRAAEIEGGEPVTAGAPPLDEDCAF